MALNSGVSPVSPLKKTRWRSVSTTHDDQSVALVVPKPRPEKCRAGVAWKRTGPSDARLPPIELVDPAGRHAPGLEMRAHAERRDEGRIPLCECLDRPVIEVVEMIVRHEHRIEGR